MGFRGFNYSGILASGFSEQLHKRRQKYNILLDEVLRDGKVTTQEENEMEQLRQTLGLTKEETERLFDTRLRNIEHKYDHCPHCHKPLNSDKSFNTDTKIE